MDSFFDACCIVETDQQAQASTLYARYQQWCEARGHPPVTQKVFGGWLRDRGFVRKRKKDGYHWLGIGLSDSDGEPSGELSPRRENEAEQAGVVLEWLEWLEDTLQSDVALKNHTAWTLKRLGTGAIGILEAAREIREAIEAHKQRATHP